MKAIIETVSHFYVETKEMPNLHASAFIYRIVVIMQGYEYFCILCHSRRALCILEQRFAETITKVIRCNPEIIRYVVDNEFLLLIASLLISLLFCTFPDNYMFV